MHEDILNTEEESIEDFVTTYRNLFPPHIKTMDSKPFRGSRSDCIHKMKWFLNEFPEYSRDLILEATKKYIQEKRLRGFEYVQQANMFIRREHTSNLESFCESIKEGWEKQKIDRVGGI